MAKSGVLLRCPDLDELAADYLALSEVQKKRVGDRFDILCADSLHYEAEIKERENNTVRLHFSHWPIKYDFVGDIETIYLAPLGKYSIPAGITAQNRYKKIVDTVHRRPHGDADASQYGEYFDEIRMDNVAVDEEMDVLCEDGKNYHAVVVKRVLKWVHLHFPHWPASYDYKGLLADIYITDKGRYSVGISPTNDYRQSHKYKQKKRRKRTLTEDMTFNVGHAIFIQTNVKTFPPYYANFWPDIGWWSGNGD